MQTHKNCDPRYIIIENKGGGLLVVSNYQVVGFPRFKCWYKYIISTL